MDSLTAHYVARELDAAWRGRRVSAFALDSRGPAVVLGAGERTVRFDLSRPECRVIDAERSGERGVLDGYQIAGVDAPTDERQLIVRLEKPGKFRGSASRGATLTISAVPNARGAALASTDGHRFGAVGAAIPPRAEPRPLLTAEAMTTAASSGDPRVLLSGRWVSPIIASWLIGEPAMMHDRYARIASLGPPEPSWCHGRLVPFPFCEAAGRASSLIEPRQAEFEGGDRRDDRRARAIERMRRELARAAAAPSLRFAADRLMSIAPGDPVPETIEVPGGMRVTVQWKTGDTPAAAASRLYARARSMERALATLPARIAAMEAGTDDGPAPRHRDRAPDEDRGRERLPYKRYLSSSGLEIRVGRSARDNDALTFHAAAPGDVWLHAQGSAGSHVVLRWSEDDPPPAPDLEEAALLAAWHSRARGSAVVPVTWTRRRYVRKPKGAAPGSVVLSRGDTIFVRPSPAAIRAITGRVR